MNKMIHTIISRNLFKLLKQEKNRLILKSKKNGVRKKRITIYDASESVYRKALR